MSYGLTSWHSGHAQYLDGQGERARPGKSLVERNQEIDAAIAAGIQICQPIVATYSDQSNFRSILDELQKLEAKRQQDKAKIKSCP